MLQMFLFHSTTHTKIKLAELYHCPFFLGNATVKDCVERTAKGEISFGREQQTEVKPKILNSESEICLQFLYYSEL